MSLLASIFGFSHSWTILFYLAVLILVIINWKKFEIQGMIMAIYRTKIGLKLMEKGASKYREPVRLIALIGIGVGFIGMIFATFAVLFQFYLWVIKPFKLDGSPIILPGVPLAGTGGIVFPLVIGWITFFIVMIVHEFSHGIVARAYNVKVLSSGILFLGPILGAFVEPDEKEIEKKSDIISYSIFSAGPFSNLLLAFAAILALIFVLGPIGGAISQQGGIIISPQEDYPAMAAGIPANTVINEINGIKTLNATSFAIAASGIKPNESVTLSNSGTGASYTFTTVAYPGNETRGYMGINLKNYVKPVNDRLYTKVLFSIIEWLARLFNWLFIISASIGIINLFPIFITDGARMLKVAFEKLIKDKKKADKAWAITNKICLLFFLAIIFVPLLRWMFF